MARAHLALAYAAGPSDLGDHSLSHALRISHEHRLSEVWTLRSRHLSAPLLRRATERGLGPPGCAAGLAARAGAEVFQEIAEALRSAPEGVRRSLGDAGVREHDVARSDLELLALDRSSHVDAGSRASGAELRLLSLGGFGVERGGERVPNAAFGRARARAVLAALLAAGVPVHRDQLLEWSWPDLDPERGVRAFHVTMSAMRRAVEPDLERGAASSVVATEGDTYRVLLGESVTFDAEEFVRLVEAGVDDPDPDAQRASLTAALALHSGDPFPEWPYDAWVEGLRNRVQRARVRALETLGENLLDGGRGADAVEPLSTLVELDRCLEAGHRGLMRAYQAAGERARALRQFHACRSALVREQGVEPSAETRDLYASILSDG